MYWSIPLSRQVNKNANDKIMFIFIKTFQFEMAWSGKSTNQRTSHYSSEKNMVLTQFPMSNLINLSELYESWIELSCTVLVKLCWISCLAEFLTTVRHYYFEGSRSSPHLFDYSKWNFCRTKKTKSLFN